MLQTPAFPNLSNYSLAMYQLTYIKVAIVNITWYKPQPQLTFPHLLSPSV